MSTYEGAKAEINKLVETALKIKVENEVLRERVKECKRLLKSCNTEDRSDMVLTIKMLEEALEPPIN